MNLNNRYQRQLEQAEPLGINEKQMVENKLCFTYCQAVGENIYRMITSCCPNISYTIMKLSQYSNCPAAIHYQSLIHLYPYLKATKTHGIYYWREQPWMDLSEGDIHGIKQNGNYHATNIETRKTKQRHLLMAYVDSDYTSDTSYCCSVTGFHVNLSGGKVFQDKTSKYCCQELNRGRIHCCCRDWIPRGYCAKFENIYS